MKQMSEILEKVYENPELRKSIVPLFIGNPGMGKTKIIEQFAKDKDATLVELITSQMSPFEISGIAMPDKDTKKMSYYNFDKLENLKDGDILFFDELLNGNPVVLNACLTILEQRRLISGKELPDIMIIAAANPQGMVPITPQIKERFLWYNVKFDPPMWKDYMKNKYDMPENVSQKLSDLIIKENFIDNNFNTPRSLDKAVNMIINDCPTPYYDHIIDSLESNIVNLSVDRDIKLSETIILKPGDSINWLDTLKHEKPEETIISFEDKIEPSKIKKDIFFKGHAKGKKLVTITLLKNILGLSDSEAREYLDTVPHNLSGDCSNSLIQSYKDAFKDVEAELEVVETEIKPVLYNITLDTSNSKSKTTHVFKTNMMFTDEEIDNIYDEISNNSEYVLYSNVSYKKMEFLVNHFCNLDVDVHTREVTNY